MSKHKEMKRKKPSFFYKCYRGLASIFKKRVKFYYVGEKLKEGTFILSNHESSKGPLTWELFYEKEVRMMGNEEMNSGFKRLYRYQTRVYYHQKKHWNLHLARLFCLLASPMTYLFYKGLQLISIRDGIGFRRSIGEAFKALTEFKEQVIIYPEDSSQGYFKELKGFKHGFLLVCEYAYKKGYDLPITVAYIKLGINTCLIDEVVMYSQLLEKYQTRENIAEALKNRCNELGRLDHTRFNSYTKIKD